jgi:hypothetical protein
MYPIDGFIQDKMMERGLSRGALTSATGYRNGSKTLRHLDRLKQGGQVPPSFQARLVAALGVDPVDFEAVLQATREIQRVEDRRRREAEIALARAAFRPHLRLIPERLVPQPIFVAAMTGVNFWLVQALPENILMIPVVRRLHVVGQIAREHYAWTSGKAGPFGGIRGYLFRTGFESAIELNVDGTRSGHHDGSVPEGSASIWRARAPKMNR